MQLAELVDIRRVQYDQWNEWSVFPSSHHQDWGTLHVLLWPMQASRLQSVLQTVKDHAAGRLDMSTNVIGHAPNHYIQQYSQISWMYLLGFLKAQKLSPMSFKPQKLGVSFFLFFIVGLYRIDIENIGFCFYFLQNCQRFEFSLGITWMGNSLGHHNELCL